MWCSERSAFVLIDFGLSTRVNERYSFQVQSKGCSAPEVLRWNARVAAHPSAEALKAEALERPGQPADVWALGCTLAKAVLGISLFRDGGPEEQITVDNVVEAQFANITSRYSSEFYADLLRFIKL
ncbi:Protein kinase domain [Trinorchestia longiramus]|nr:Protein kinase domain [Trinorchestia longiramus]